MTRVLHTTWISDVDSIVFVNRIKKMVSFELSKEIEKDVFRLLCNLSRACILRPSCDKVLKRIECLHCAHKHHMVSKIVVVYSFQIQEQFSHYLFAICESVYVNYQLLCVLNSSSYTLGITYVIIEDKFVSTAQIINAQISSKFWSHFQFTIHEPCP